MNIRKMTIFLAVVTLSMGVLLPTALYGAESQGLQSCERTNGYRCVFMGHSFFYPIAETFDQVAVASGFPDHKQVLRKAGATKGTPGWLWDNLPKDDEVWSTLASGDIDLLCFPHHHISGCNLEDYCKWIDYARQYNPNIMIAIAIPWGPLFDVDPQQFSDFYRTQFEIPVRQLVDTLRKKYPDNTIFVIPHGKGVAELYKKFKAGEIPEIKQVVKTSDNDTVESFFNDKGAHIGRMPLVLSQLIWLATIYQVDVRQCKWETGYQMDLKKMAYDIVSNDPYAKIVKKMPKQCDAGQAQSESVDNSNGLNSASH